MKKMKKIAPKLQLSRDTLRKISGGDPDVVVTPPIGSMWVGGCAPPPRQI